MWLLQLPALLQLLPLVLVLEQSPRGIPDSRACPATCFPTLQARGLPVRLANGSHSRMVECDRCPLRQRAPRFLRAPERARRELRWLAGQRVRRRSAGGHPGVVLRSQGSEPPRRLSPPHAAALPPPLLHSRWSMQSAPQAPATSWLWLLPGTGPGLPMASCSTLSSTLPPTGRHPSTPICTPQSLRRACSTARRTPAWLKSWGPSLNLATTWRRRAVGWTCPGASLPCQA